MANEKPSRNEKNKQYLPTWLGIATLGVVASNTSGQATADEAKSFLIPHNPRVAWYYIDENNDFWIRLVDASWVLVPKSELSRTNGTVWASSKFLEKNAPELLTNYFIDGDVVVGTYHQDLGENAGLFLSPNLPGISSIGIFSNNLELYTDDGAQIIIRSRYFELEDGHIKVDLQFLEKYANKLIPYDNIYPTKTFLGHFDETSPYNLDGGKVIEFSYADSSTHFKGGGFEFHLDDGQVILVPEFAVVSAGSNSAKINKTWFNEYSQFPKIYWNSETDEYQDTEPVPSLTAGDDHEAEAPGNTGDFPVLGLLGGVGLLGAATGSASQSSNLSNAVQSIINVYDGPLENALVFIDDNENGELDDGELNSRTDEFGNAIFNIDTSDKSVIALTDELTIDRISNEVLAGLKLTAPKGSTVISPLTTLIDETDLTDAQIRSSFSLPDSFDFLNDNPFDGSFSDNDKTKIISTNTQIIASSSSFSSILQGVGMSKYEAFETAMVAFASTTEEKIVENSNFKVDLTSNTFLTEISDYITTNNNYSLEIQNTISAIKTQSITAIQNINVLFSFENLTSASSMSEVLSIMDLVPDQLATAAKEELSTPGSGNDAITFSVPQNLISEVPYSRATYSVIAYDVSTYDEDVAISDTNKVTFIGNEELKFTFSEEPQIKYLYSDDQGTFDFSGNLDSVNVEFMDAEIPLFELDTNGYPKMDVMIARNTAPDGSFWDTMVVHAYSQDDNYVGSFVWVMGGEDLTITNQQEFDTLVMAAFPGYAEENIPDDVEYGPGNADWLTFESSNSTSESTSSSADNNTISPLENTFEFSVIAYDVSTYDEDVAISDTNKVTFIGNEELKFTFSEEPLLQYKSSDVGALGFSGNLDSTTVEFMDTEIPLFDIHSDGYSLAGDVLVERSTAPDGAFWDYMVVHSELGSFMWFWSGEDLSIANQQEFDTLLMTPFMEHIPQEIPDDVTYGLEQGEWLISLDII